MKHGVRALALAALIAAWVPAAQGGEKKIILGAFFQGCESTCEGMKAALAASGFDADLVVRDLAQDKTKLPAFVEEALRYDGPVQMLFRETTQAVRLSGTTIPRGSIVLPMFASANRDAAQFPEPDRFDIDRDTRGHVAFGFGIHFCLGASLARLEARVGFEELWKRVSKIRRLESDVEYVDSFLLRGPRRLPLAADEVLAGDRLLRDFDQLHARLLGQTGPPCHGRPVRARPRMGRS